MICGKCKRIAILGLWGLTFGLLGAFGCGGSKEARHANPLVEAVTPVDSPAAIEVIGEGTPPGFLRACETLSTASGLVEVGCDDHRIVEFRRPQNGANADADMDTLISVLGDRFGKLKEKRLGASIDENPVRVSDFHSEGEDAVSGRAVLVENKEGQFWALVCYRKGADAIVSFCGDAIASAARAGGLAHAEARPVASFISGKMKVPASCQEIAGREVRCPSGKLSWSQDDSRNPAEILRETIATLSTTAKKENMTLVQEHRACTLFEQGAQCEIISISSDEGSGPLFVLALPDRGEGRLVVCSSGAQTLEPLPSPCDLAIVIAPQK